MNGINTAVRAARQTFVLLLNAHNNFVNSYQQLMLNLRQTIAKFFDLYVAANR